MSKWRWVLLQISRMLWVRATLIGLLAVAAAVIATAADRFVPLGWTFAMGADAVDSILTIIASSMLAVTTFSLSTLTAALSGATSNVTPRATKLLMQDRVTQNVLSTFIGSFLFSIVGIVVLKTKAYGAQGRAVMFVVTIFVLILIVVSLLRWIDRLLHLGRVAETTTRVEEAASQAISMRLTAPYLGGLPLDDAPEAARRREIRSQKTGYVIYIDMAALNACAEALAGQIDLARLPGGFVYEGTTLARISADIALSGDDEAALRATFQIGDARSYDQDPRFGLIVLSEIASRALSPAVNDPGTAIDVIGRITRLLTLWSHGSGPRQPDPPRYPHLRVPALQSADLFADAFAPIGRDGATLIEVQMRLQKALIALNGMGDSRFRAAALTQSLRALAHADAALALETDKQALRALLPWGGETAQDVQNRPA